MTEQSTKNFTDSPVGEGGYGNVLMTQTFMFLDFFQYPFYTGKYLVDLLQNRVN